MQPGVLQHDGGGNVKPPRAQRVNLSFFSSINPTGVGGVDFLTNFFTLRWILTYWGMLFFVCMPMDSAVQYVLLWRINRRRTADHTTGKNRQSPGNVKGATIQKLI